MYTASMNHSFDLFWSFRSPYSYLATGRIVEMEKAYQLQVNVRPVYPLAVREKSFFKKVNPLWPRYLLIDTVRIAEMLGIPYSWPQPDPIVQDYETFEVAEQQPYIHRLTRLGIAAVERGKGLSFIEQVSRLIWSGVVGWDQGDHLTSAVQRAGLNLSDLDKTIAADPDYYDKVIHENEQAHYQAGHWGVPTMVFDNEPFFGQDRLDLLLWRMKQKGLKKRGET